MVSCVLSVLRLLGNATCAKQVRIALCVGQGLGPCSRWLINLCKLVKRGAVRANDLPLSNELEAWPGSSVGRALTYIVRGREFESRSGRLFSRTFTFQT